MMFHHGQPDNTYTAAQLHEIGCGSYSGIRRRYKKNQKESSHKIVVNGNNTDCFPFHLLKAKDQAKVAAWKQQQDLAALAEISARAAITSEEIAAISPPPRQYHTDAQHAGADLARKLKEQEIRSIEDRRIRQEMYLAMYASLPEKAKRAAQARYDMLETCRTFHDKSGCKARAKDGKPITWNNKVLKSFCRAFIDGTLELPPNVTEFFVRKGKRSLTPTSLTNWRDTYQEQGLYGLADHYVSKSGATILTAAQQEFVIGMVKDFPHSMPTKIYKGMKARFKGMELPTRHTISRFVKHWKSTNKSLYLFITNPDEWRSRHMFAFGSASEDVNSLNQRWEADSTKADVMCSDGRSCVIGIIDVWSRRFKLHVSPTSKATAIAALFRRCIIAWGLPQEFRTDCGTDYTSFHIERICDALEVNHHLCNEFHPEEKPHIERAFKTFSHDIVELLPGYVGHSVADRKDIEARKSFANRLMTKGETVEVKMTMKELQAVCDQWSEAIYHQDRHAGLNGMTPAAKARSWTGAISRISNERALDVLLYPAPSNDGMRKIGKKGVEVTFAGVKLYYRSAEMAGHEGEMVQVLIDETDLGRAPLFLENGEFLAIGEDPNWLGISSQEVAYHAKAKQKQVLAEQKKEVKRIAKQADTRNIATDILKSRQDEAAKIMELSKQKQVEEYTTLALDEAAVAVAERDRKTAIPCGNPISEEDIAKNAEWLRSIEKTKIEKSSDPFFDKYQDLKRKVKVGDATDEEIAYVEEYAYWLDTGKFRGTRKLWSVG